MKPVFRSICLLFGLVFLLAGCERPGSALNSAGPGGETPVRSSAPSQAPPASATPSATPGVEPTPQSPSASPSKAKPPVDLEKADPLLTALAKAVMLSGSEGFERLPDGAFVDQMIYYLLADGSLSKGFEGITQVNNVYTLPKSSLQSLYLSCFSEGEFTSLPKDGFAVANKNEAVYTIDDLSDLQCSLKLKNGFTPLAEGYYEVKMSLIWSYPEESQVVNGGDVLLWVKPDESSPFGLRLAKAKVSISLRPGDVFGAYPARDMEFVKPILHSILKASYFTKDGFQGSPGDTFAWIAAHTLVNCYGGDFGLDLSGKSVYVSKDTMQKIFEALFGSEFSIPSTIPSKASSRVSISGGGYSFTRMEEDTTLTFADYRPMAGSVDVFSVALTVENSPPNNPTYLCNAEIFLQYQDGAKYKNRYAGSAIYTQRKS